MLVREKRSTQLEIIACIRKRMKELIDKRKKLHKNNNNSFEGHVSHHFRPTSKHLKSIIDSKVNVEKEGKQPPHFPIQQ